MLKIRGYLPDLGLKFVVFLLEALVVGFKLRVRSLRDLRWLEGSLEALNYIVFVLFAVLEVFLMVLDSNFSFSISYKDTLALFARE